MKHLVFAAAALAAMTSLASSAHAQAFDPRSYQSRHVGQATQILVLGTPHLSETPDNFDPAVLEPLLARLAAFHPDAIAIEALPGRSIAQMWQYREAYPDVAHDYGGRAMVLAALARSTLNLEMADAEAEVRRTLATWPASPTPEQRRRLAALFCASGDPASAMVQWWRLDTSERHNDDSVSRMLAEQLATYDTPARRNENTLVAARLAVRLGLERVYPMDDQSDDLGRPNFAHDLDQFVGDTWAGLANDAHFGPLIHATDHLDSGDQTLAAFRTINRPDAGRTNADGQWLTLINRASPHDVGRARVAVWETRNLRMAANIREAASQYPGGRVLVIVGWSHKPWLDAYLSMMSDVQVVDAERVLR